ncbi:MAG: type II toxin-antitoxin system HicB family antitoxin [Spirulinaceae cyanobacterium]
MKFEARSQTKINSINSKERGFRIMMQQYTAKYTKISTGYMGQLVEWPEVVTEGLDLEECRLMLRDATQEMVLAYQEQDREIPLGDSLIESVSIEVNSVSQTT